MKGQIKNEWLKGGGSFYRTDERGSSRDQGLRVVFGGRTWIIRPEAN